MSAYPIASTRKPAAESRGCLPTLIVLVIMVGILAGGVAVQSAIADLPPQSIEVAGGVTITPPGGWEFGGRSEDGKTVLLSQGIGSVAITVVDDQELAVALAELRNEWLASGTVTAAEPGPIDSVRPGQAAFGFAYSGTFPDLGSPVEGAVAGYLGTSVSVIFDGWAGVGDYRLVRDEINAIVTATVIP